jgi:hypothetical protein
MCKLEMWGIQITQKLCTAWIQFWFMFCLSQLTYLQCSSSCESPRQCCR